MGRMACEPFVPACAQDQTRDTTSGANIDGKRLIGRMQTTQLGGGSAEIPAVCREEVDARNPRYRQAPQHQ